MAATLLLFWRLRYHDPDHHRPWAFPILGLDRVSQFDYRQRTMGTDPTYPCPDGLCPPAMVDDGRPLAGEEATLELATLAKAVGHPARVQILRILAERETCVCGELVGEFTLAQSTISEHLRILKDAGLIRGEIRPPHVCYCLEPSRVTRLKALIASL